jgi:hypothetical protein
MAKKPQYTTWLKWILVVILFVGIFQFTLDFFQIKNLKPDTIQDQVIMNIGIFLMVFIALGVHELGHLIVGLKNGFRFEFFVVGFLGIKRNDQRIEFYFNKNLGYFGGVAATSPVDDNKNNARKFAQVLIAGPITSILFAVLCFAIIPFFNGYFGIVVYAGAMISLGIFFTTTIPTRTGMFFTDRKRYQRLVTPGKAQLVELAIFKIIGVLSRDKSYKNIDKNDLYILIEDELPFFQFYGLFNLICYQLEINGKAEEKVLEDYQRISKKMSKIVVASFDKEIETFSA